MEKILLIEPNKHHLETLYPQILFLKESNYQVYLAIDKFGMELELLNSLQTEVNFIVRKESEHLFFFFHRLKKLMKEEGIELVILNTLEGSKSILPYYLFLKDNKTIRIIHNLDLLFKDKIYDKKIKNYLVQKLFKKINEKIEWNFVLNESLYKTAINKGVKNIDFFYPSYFKDFLDLKDINIGCKEKNDVIKIGIQGNVSFNRRNYLGLLEGLKGIDKKYKNRLNIYIIGNINTEDGETLLKEIEKNSLEDVFFYFNEFLSYEKYFKLIVEMDFLMPLIDKNVSDFDMYNKYKITSTVSMALAFKTPMINSTDFYLEDKYKSVSLYYNETEILGAIKKAIDISSEEYNKLVNAYNEFDEVDYELQKKKYIDRIKEVMKGKIVCRNKDV